MAAMTKKAAQTRWYGPPLVALGAGLWGVETLYRVNLQKHFGPDVLVFFEHVIGVLILLPMLLWNWKAMQGLSRRAWSWILVSAVVGSAFGTVFFTASLARINISVANVLLNLQPVWSVMVARYFLKERTAPGFPLWAALAMASGIVIGIEHFDAGRFHVADPMGLLFVLGTILCWGTATVAGRALMMETPLGVAAPLRFIFGMLGTLAIVLVNGHGAQMASQFPLLTDALILKEYLLLLLVAGLTPLFFYFYGLKYTSAVAGAFCEMSQTLAALLITWGVMGQPLAMHQVVAAAVLMAAVVRINLLQAKFQRN